MEFGNPDMAVDDIPGKPLAHLADFERRAATAHSGCACTARSGSAL
jgi:hypothetical protein